MTDFQPHLVVEVRIGNDLSLAVAEIAPSQFAVALVPHDDDTPETELFGCNDLGLITIGQALIHAAENGTISD